MAVIGAAFGTEKERSLGLSGDEGMRRPSQTPTVRAVSNSQVRGHLTRKAGSEGHSRLQRVRLLSGPFAQEMLKLAAAFLISAGRQPRASALGMY